MLAGLYVLLGLNAIFRARLVHDEGLATYFFARFLGDDVPAAFFFQKLKPVVSALYAPVARLGVVPFELVHLLVGASALVLVASTARALGIRRATVAAAVVGFSPLFLVAGPTGLSNGDGVVAVSLCLWLLVGSRRAWPAGLVLGALPWVRAELVLLVVVLLLHEALTRRRLGFFLACAAFPAAYLLLGALYHHDVLWALHYPPSAPATHANPLWQGVRRQGELGNAAASLALVTPALALAWLVRRARLHSVELAGGAFALASLVALNVLPRFEAFNFDYSPRYLLLALPVLALLAARATDGLVDGEPPSWAELPAFALALLLADRVRAASGSPVELGLVAAVALALLVARAGAPRVAAAAWVALLLAGPALVSKRMREWGYDGPASLAPMARWVERHPELVAGRAVYTNASCLPTYLHLAGLAPDARLFFIAQADHRYEIEALGNPANGQRQAILRSMSRTFYGPLADLHEARAADLPRDALFLLTRDPRLQAALSEDVSSHLRAQSQEPDFDVATLAEGP